MKRAVLSLAMIAGISSGLFATEEIWFAVGANFGNYFESGSDLGSFYMGSAGINLSSHAFANKKNIGVFFNIGLLFPVANTIEDGFNPVSHINFLIGPGFRYSINENLKLHFGIGVDFSRYSLLAKVNKDIQSSDYRVSLGIGAEAGLKYDITDVIYVDFGTTLAYNFAGAREASSTLDNWKNTRRDASGWISGYSLVGIRPYIAMGFNCYQENAQWGKPK